MDVKQTKVTLVTKKGVRQDFELSHAERLLRLGPAANGGWAIAPESKFFFEESNGTIRIKSDKGNSPKAK